MCKICYIIQDLSYGGIPTFIINLATKLKGKFEFYFVATDNSDINIRFHELGHAHYFGHNWDKITRFFKEQKIDIVQFGNCLSYKECALKAKVPIIIERTAGPRSCHLNREGVTHVISSTKGTVPLIERNYSGPISILYNGVSLDRFSEVVPDRHYPSIQSDGSVRQKMFDDDQFVICYCARIGGIGQGHAELIRSVIEVRKTHDVKLLIIGDRLSSSSEDIRKHLYKLSNPIRDHVVFTGRMFNPIPAVAGADLFVCPAYHHGISNAIIEACALGVPVVATNVGQTREIVHNGKNGYLVPPKNISELVKNIIKMVDSPKKRSKFGAYSKQLVRDKFNIEDTARKYAELYKNLLEQAK